FSNGKSIMQLRHSQLERRSLECSMREDSNGLLRSSDAPLCLIARRNSLCDVTRIRIRSEIDHFVFDDANSVWVMKLHYWTTFNNQYYIINDKINVEYRINIIRSDRSD
ncbi:hypothetical protein PENTCL1PPCAC_24256, partial [Pristionchus entomophagus]